MLVKFLLIIFMFSEKNGKKVDLLKPNPLMQEKAKKEEEEKVAEAQRGLHWYPETDFKNSDGGAIAILQVTNLIGRRSCGSGWFDMRHE